MGQSRGVRAGRNIGQVARVIIGQSLAMAFDKACTRIKNLSRRSILARNDANTDQKENPFRVLILPLALCMISLASALNAFELRD
jgi:hypothetical protein